MDLQGLLIGMLVMSVLLVLPIMIRDWYGLANAIGMGMSVLVRRFVVEDLRETLDHSAVESIRTQRGAEKVQALIVMPDGTLVTVNTPRGIMVDCFTRMKPNHQHRIRRSVIRTCGWLGFGIQVVTLGICSLTVQLYTIALLIGGSVFLVRGIGADNSILGRRLSIKTQILQDPDRRLSAYSRLDLQVSQEEFLIRLGMMPQRENTVFWEEYTRARAVFHHRHEDTKQDMFSATTDAKEMTNSSGLSSRTSTISINSVVE
ncbi:hypothetical protein ASPZODRAFT_133189 [Penicilliopsis zonata CBS 506.65]|uniref:Uncharacterized protein n=1 Tax=Penicilliopsis zonata CBS 506.65 TaxID=1073090 RepID=A0A1L9SFZ0_9EURO|nr:hypothetical protein ASPZODRAFT_133189 [Penicilliopsis zonata CBS 506.65]OJJ46185.1 hypothetical protein ASPZODRAFT_133189 [Penicilliopsis zonata CBS 506.65]